MNKRLIAGALAYLIPTFALGFSMVHRCTSDCAASTQGNFAARIYFSGLRLGSGQQGPQQPAHCAVIRNAYGRVSGHELPPG
jgi:hypothetical protein